MMPSSLRLKSQPQQQQNINNQKTSSFQLPSSLRLKSQVTEFPYENENDLEREIERSQAQLTSRGIETIAGLPGDIESLGRHIFGLDPDTYLPTSEKLQNVSENASLGYTKPKNEFEERMGEVVKDVASFALPGSGKYNFVRNIGIPVVANLVKEGVKYAGGEKVGDAAKIGTMIVLDLMNLKGGGAKKFAGNLFNESEKLIPEGATLKSAKFEKSLFNLDKSLSSGGSAPSTEKALKKVSEIQSKMKNGEIEVKELIDFRKNINEIRSELGGFEVQLPKHIKQKAIANLDTVKKQVINALDEYGLMNKEFGKINKSANEAYAAYETSDKLARFIEKTVKNTVKSPLAKSILGLSSIGGGVMYPAIAAKAGAVAAPLYVGYESYKVLHQVMNSPILRKFYGNILKGAASGNTAQVINNSKALDKELSQSD